MTTHALIVPTTSYQRTVLRWMPTFLGFPAGGLAAKLIVGPIDSVGAALAGGAVSGAALGIAQWLGIRRLGLAPEPWVAATAAGMAFGLVNSSNNRVSNFFRMSHNSFAHTLIV